MNRAKKKLYKGWKRAVKATQVFTQEEDADDDAK